MKLISVQERYDQFQEQAVSNILSDFTKKPYGRFLLVIPTGGKGGVNERRGRSKRVTPAL